MLRVWWNGDPFRIDCNIADGVQLRAILGRKACVGMGMVRLLASDATSQPDTQGHRVFEMQEAPLSLRTW